MSEVENRELQMTTSASNEADGTPILHPLPPSTLEEPTEAESEYRAKAEEVYDWLAQQRQVRVPRAFKRADIVNAFHDAFELIGGTTRLALWAHENPGEFFKLYAKMLPSHATSEIDQSGEIKIVHAIKPGALDGVVENPPVIEGAVIDDPGAEIEGKFSKEDAA